MNRFEFVAFASYTHLRSRGQLNSMYVPRQCSPFEALFYRSPNMVASFFTIKGAQKLELATG